MCSTFLSVPLSVISSWKKIKAMGVTNQLLVTALRTSEKLVSRCYCYICSCSLQQVVGTGGHVLYHEILLSSGCQRRRQESATGAAIHRATQRRAAGQSVLIPSITRFSLVPEMGWKLLPLSAFYPRPNLADSCSVEWSSLRICRTIPLETASRRSSASLAGQNRIEQTTPSDPHVVL